MYIILICHLPRDSSGAGTSAREHRFMAKKGLFSLEPGKGKESAGNPRELAAHMRVADEMGTGSAVMAPTPTPTEGIPRECSSQESCEQRGQTECGVSDREWCGSLHGRRACSRACRRARRRALKGSTSLAREPWY